MKIQKYKKNEAFSYVLGAALVIDALDNSNIIEIYIHPNTKESDSINKIIEYAKDNGINIINSDKPFNILTKKQNCFVIAKIQKEKKVLDDKNHVVLVNPSDFGNLGTIVRTSLGFGINNIAIIRDAVDVYDPKCIRASMGAFFKVNIEYFDSIEDYLKRFKNRAFYSFMLDAQTKLQTVENSVDKYSLIFGNEAHGLDDKYKRFTTPIIIPQTSDVDSFNLPISVGIALYHFTKKDFE